MSEEVKAPQGEAASAAPKEVPATYANGDTEGERAKLIAALRKAKVDDDGNPEKPEKTERKPKPKAKEDKAEMAEDGEADEKPKAKAKPSKGDDEADEKPAPKKAKADDDESDDEPDSKPKKASKKAASADDDEEPAKASDDDEQDTEASDAESEEDDADAKAKAEKTAKLERLKARIDAEKKRQREAIQRNRALEQERQRLLEAQRHLEAERKQREELEKRVSSLREKPLDVLRELGVAPEDIVKRAVEDGSPEAILRRQAAELDRLKQEIAKEREDYRRAQEQAQREAQVTAIRNAFVTEAKNEEAYPNVAAIAEDDPDLIVEMGESIARKAYQATGYSYGNDEILELLEQRLAKRNKASKQTSGTPTGKVRQTETTNGTGAQARTATGTTRTLNAKTATQRATASSGSFDDLSPEEQQAYLAKAFRERAWR